MSNHPNRGKANPGGARNPTPAQVLAAREKADLTQTEAAEVIYGTLRAWQNWENDQDLNEQRRMHPGLYELFLAKTGQMRKEFYEKCIAGIPAKARTSVRAPITPTATHIKVEQPKPGESKPPHGKPKPSILTDIKKRWTDVHEAGGRWTDAERKKRELKLKEVKAQKAKAPRGGDGEV